MVSASIGDLKNIESTGNIIGETGFLEGSAFRDLMRACAVAVLDELGKNMDPNSKDTKHFLASLPDDHELGPKATAALEEVHKYLGLTQTGPGNYKARGLNIEKL